MSAFVALFLAFFLFRHYTINVGGNLINELVKYGNQMNEIPFRKFNKRDLNIFFAIVSRMRDKGKRKVTFSFYQLMKLSGLSYHHHTSLFIKDLKETYQRMLNLTIYYEDEKQYASWVLFTGFRINYTRKQCDIKVNPDLVGVLNNLVKQFTRFSLVEFSRLDSTYSKSMFRLIKQFRTTGKLILSSDKFRYLLCIPKSYDNYAIKVRILKPILLELSPIIGHLRIKRIKGDRNTVISYHITFTPESNKQDDFNKDNLMGEQWMLHNIKSNPYLSEELQNKAVKKVVQKVGSRKKIPMDKFNKILKEQPTRRLKDDLILYKKYHILRLTEYQARKLRRTIKERR